MSCVAISPVVRVPVLSEHNTDTQPIVSTASIFRTTTARLYIASEAIINEMVTVGSNPSGTCANSAAQLFCKMSDGERFTGESKLAIRLNTPTTTATMAMMCTKCSICISNVDFVRADLMLWAILPKNVLSPVACTRHVALPFLTLVPKKHRLRASSGRVFSRSGLDVLGCGMDSPVSAALSTSIPSEQCRMRTSAGTLSPAFTKMISPGTKFAGSKSTSSREPVAEEVRTTHAFDMACAFVKASIVASAWSSACHCKRAAMMMTAERIIGVTRSASFPP
mmetsp:Transcript_66858/g.186683  ORF Transcript_66858/g.186683 Transcript_66858/m.186683 type:complete len:280 (+) Transcript_66858:1910-2749(+)